MFVSRNFGHEILGRNLDLTGKPVGIPVILVAEPSTRSSTRLDKYIFPAVLGEIVKDLYERGKTTGKPETLPVQLSVVALTVVRPARAYSTLFPADTVFIDGFSKWNNVGYSCKLGDLPVESRICQPIGLLEALKVIDRHLSTIGSASGVVLVLDSISPWVPGERTAAQFAEAVDRWRLSGKVVAFLSSVRDSGGENSPERCTISGLMSLATTRVHVRQVTSVQRANGGSSFSGENMEGSVSILEMNVCRLKPSARVQKERFFGYIDKVTRTITFSLDAPNANSLPVGSHGGVASKEDASLGKLRTLGLTFNVELSEQERIARSQVQLPYVHRNEDVANQGLEMHPSYLSTDRELQRTVGGSLLPVDDSDEEEFEESEDV